MNARRPNVFTRFAVLTLLLIAATLPAALQAQVCSGQIPGRFVPGPPPNHDPAAPGIDLWIPEVFRPGLTGRPNRQLPADRDSTEWDSIFNPGYHTGLELFESVDVLGDHLYVAYNSGFSIWDVSGGNAENPVRIKVRDGWNKHPCPADPDCGPFLSFPSLPAEVDQLIEDIDVLEASGGTNVYIAVSGKNPVGLSLWRFNTNSKNVSAIYQDIDRPVSRQVRLVRSGGRLYVFSSYSGGIAVYDLTQAIALGQCLEETGTDCPGVYRGDVGSITSGRFVDVLQRPTGELLIAASDARVSGPSGQGLELWQMNDPANPGVATQLFDGLDPETYGSALFSHEGNDYLAAVENDGSLNKIRIWNINACGGGGGACSLGASLFDLPGPRFLSDQFLTYSTSDGTPFLYYGLFANGLPGPQVEQLLDLTTLGRAGQNITEMTDGGATYLDNCAEEDLDYWAWYYPGNEFGPKNLTPRIGKFHPDSGYFYRAARGILDVHVWEGFDPLEPTVITTVNDPDPEGLYWMGDDVTFEAEGSDGCNPAGMWEWAATTPAEIDAELVSQMGSQATFRFDCNTTERCADSVVSVSGSNDDPSCAGAEEVPAFITVKDPTFDITGIDPSSGTFTQCDDVTFTAELVGRGPVGIGWVALRDDHTQEVQETFDDTVNAEDLSTASPMFTWDTSTAVFATIFVDGFESGDTSAWSQSPPVAESFRIDAELGAGGPSASSTVELTSVSGDPEFEMPAIESSTEDNSSFDFHANTVPGTVSDWSWELEDDNGQSLCTFGVDDDVPCTLKAGQDISHTWLQQTGVRRVALTISNCQTAATAEASTMVTVESVEPLEVTGFELDRAQSAEACEIDFDCINQLICVCFINETIFFEVTATGGPDFYDFDWDGDGNFEDAGNAPGGTEFTHVYTEPIGQVRPAVQARRGGAEPVERDLLETLDIQDASGPLAVTSFELDRLQSVDACEIDFDCINDLICICYVDETIFFEVTSSGDPDFYDFDWNGDGAFEDTNNPTTGTEFTKVYPFELNPFKPTVRARRGAATPAVRDLRETLEIRESSGPLEVTRFNLDRTASSDACEIDFDCINDLVCVCYTGETVFIQITSSGGPQAYDFDWDGNGSYEDANNQANSTVFTHVYPQPIGQVVPAVRARRDSATAFRDLRETLDIQDRTDGVEITSFELDRAQSADACEIDFDCINGLICVCHVDETIFFEVNAVGNPDFYDFDWDGNGSFEDTANPANGTEFTHLYTQAIGEVKPAARARKGAQTSADEDLRETLDIQP